MLAVDFLESLMDKWINNLLTPQKLTHGNFPEPGTRVSVLEKHNEHLRK